MLKTSLKYIINIFLAVLISYQGQALSLSDSDINNALSDTSFDETPNIQKVIINVLKGEHVSSDLLLKATNEKEKPEEKIDLFLESLLQTPFEYRQYVFPAIFESPFIPKKVRTHPEVAIWKGTVPTRIAPHLNEYATKYLADLNPRLYLFLAPEKYQQPDTGKDKVIIKPTDLSKRSPFPDEAEPFQGYLPIQAYFHLPIALQNNPKMSYLTSDKIHNLKSGFKTLSTFLTQQEDTESFQSALRLLKMFYTKPEENLINPVQSQVQRIRLMKRGDALDTVFKAIGWENADDFAKAADTAAKAYRANFLTLPLAFSFHEIKGKTEPMSVANRTLLTNALMHEALPEDVRLVGENLTLIRQVFQESEYSNILNPLLVDSEEKIEYTVPNLN